MDTRHQLLHASGYLTVLIAPALLAVAAWFNLPFLVIGLVLLVFPLARFLFGAINDSEPPLWGEGIATALDQLPRIYVAVLAAALWMVLVELSSTHPRLGGCIGWMLSLWATLMFATCVAHELLHRRNRVDRILGHILAGVAGYAVLGHEHTRHHHLPGSTAAAEWPKLSESVWRFAVRRISKILLESLGPRGPALAGNRLASAVRGLRIALGTTALTITLFLLAAGWRGLLIYLSILVLVAFTMQVVTYLQHWGLGDDSLPDARHGDYGWEGDCQFQAWVTLGLSLHHSHHRSASQPYYRLALSMDSPRPPAGYVLLMFVALVPAVWLRVMMPALSYWKAQPTKPLSSGRKLACVAFYR